MSKSIAEQQLKVQGLKKTEARLWLLSFLSKSQEGCHAAPQTVEECFSAAKKEKRSVDLVTLYRTLATFEEKGLVSRVLFDDGLVRYELNCQALHEHDRHHHHVVCRKCKRIEALPEKGDCLLLRFEQMLKRRGYQAVSHRLEFSGICSQCQG